jgi:ADP-ribosyl-[dinitrogen reductase] hydrolase
MDRRERAVGCVLGLALGGTFGAPFESRRRHEIPDPVPAFELPWMDLAPGSATDDTAMAQNLVRSLVAHDGLDTEDVLRRQVAWLRTDPPGVGTLTRDVLNRSGAGRIDAAREYVELRGPEVSAGNGSVTWCAPLGVAYAGRPDRLVELAPNLSAITHWDERCRTACLAVTIAAAALVRGVPADQAVVDAISGIGGRPGDEELEYLVDQAGRARPVDGPDSAFVFFATGIALRIVAERVGFEDGLRSVVGLGGDTGANAAVAGALLGALHGRPGLPHEWLERLQHRIRIEQEAGDLAELAQRTR